MQKTLLISPFTIAKVFLLIIAFLLSANLGIIYLKFFHGYDNLKGFSYFFYFDYEANFPSFYSAFTIFLSALLLSKIGRSSAEVSKGHKIYWSVLPLYAYFLPWMSSLAFMNTLFL